MSNPSKQQQRAHTGGPYIARETLHTGRKAQWRSDTVKVFVGGRSQMLAPRCRVTRAGQPIEADFPQERVDRLLARGLLWDTEGGKRPWPKDRSGLTEGRQVKVAPGVPESAKGGIVARVGRDDRGRDTDHPFAYN